MFLNLMRIGDVVVVATDEDWLEQRVKNPKTGNMVKVKSLPTEERRKYNPSLKTVKPVKKEQFYDFDKQMMQKYGKDYTPEHLSADEKKKHDQMFKAEKEIQERDFKRAGEKVGKEAESLEGNETFKKYAQDLISNPSTMKTIEKKKRFYPEHPSDEDFMDLADTAIDFNKVLDLSDKVGVSDVAFQKAARKKLAEHIKKSWGK